MPLTLQNVRKDYVAPDRSVLTVLDITEFTLGDGEQVALVGTSGSGKTT
ncbi:MAG: ABC transporter ATP-binding protein, partial [Anaerolineae bacterium]|nr:ABC transporter ATP-binding protein [Phycisphaerae bacterium]